MKRIVTQVLVAAGLAAGACGVAEAHTDLSIGLSLGAPAPVYVQPGPTYVQPAPVYSAPQPVYYGGPRWRGDWDHRGWDHRGWDRDRHGWRDGDRGGWDHDRGRGWGWRG